MRYILTNYFPLDISRIIEEYLLRENIEIMQKCIMTNVMIELKSFALHRMFFDMYPTNKPLLNIIKERSPFVNKKKYGNKLENLIDHHMAFSELKRSAFDLGADMFKYSTRKKYRYVVSFRGKIIHFCPNNNTYYKNAYETNEIYNRCYKHKLSKDGYPAIYDQYNHIYWMKNVVLGII